MEPPATDVILAYASDPALVRRTVISLRAQTRENWRVCVCAGAEEPAGLDPEGDPRVWLQTAPARTPPAAWNRALDQLGGRAPESVPGKPGAYVMLLTPGDELEPDAIERLTDHAERSLADGAASAYRREPGPEQDHAGWTVRHGSRPFATTIGLPELHASGPIRSPACVTRREAFDRSRFGAGLLEHALYDVQLRQAEHAGSWAVLEAPLARRRGRESVVDAPGRAQRAEHTMRRAVGRAVSAGFATAGMDLDAKREADLVMRAVLTEATLAALMDPEPRKSKATELVRRPWLEADDEDDDDRRSRDRLAPRPLITADLAADAAAVVLRELLVVDPDSDEWTGPLNHWWNRLVGEKWAPNTLVATARAALAERLMPDETVANAILDAIGDAKTLHTLGDPVHADTLARLSEAREHPKVIAIDPRDPDGAASNRARPSPNIPIVVAGRDDDEERALLGLLGPRGNIHRWRSVEQGMIQRSERALTAVWGRRTVSPTAGASW